MRDMRPDPDRGFPSQYICSDCNWSFPLEHLSDLADFFQQKDAILAFSIHVCRSFPLTRVEEDGGAQDAASERNAVGHEANSDSIA